jgi:ABC-2 type transport system ATP-binding protein
MPEVVLSVEHLTRRYGSFVAVDDLSFEVHSGEIFGLLGPNGAGKTTTIRTMMGIFEPDEGHISILGKSPTEARALTGYLPEERGLYRDLNVIDALAYLAELKGMARKDAIQSAMQWLVQVGLADRAKSKVKDLSGGMQQKVQLATALIHHPKVVVLDEPFQALDPVNVDVVKTLIKELRDQGKTVILSAHQMHLVEALCDRIVLINNGKAVLYGNLAEIKERYAFRTVRLRTPQTIENLPGVVSIKQGDAQTYTLTLDGGSPQELLATLIKQKVPVESFEVGSAPLEEIFIAAVKEQPHA